MSKYNNSDDNNLILDTLLCESLKEDINLSCRALNGLITFAELCADDNTFTMARICEKVKDRLASSLDRIADALEIINHSTKCASN